MASPSVISTEKDLSFNIQSIESNASGYVGLFRWGPANEIVKITSNESELQRRFFTPDAATAVHFLSAANYMLYSVPLFVTRAISTGALNAVPADETPVLIENETAWDTATHTASVIGRYPGELGNSIKVSFADDVNFDGWDYAAEFDFKPAAGRFCVVVIDNDGILTGTAGTVLERYSDMTTALGVKKLDGTTANIVEAVRAQSAWIWIGDETLINFDLGVYEVELQGGVDDNVEDTADYQTAISAFNDTETIDIVRAFSANTSSEVQGYIVDLCDSRLDAVAFTAPNLDDVYNNPDAEDSIVEYFNTTLNKNTSYGFAVDNWKLVYDKYRDTKVWIPTNSDAAGLHARIFVNGRPWFSPAGLNNGQLKNVIRFAWNPDKPSRDILYKNHINSVVSRPGEGNVLWGDKTMLRAGSAFNRINVRTLFIILKKSISKQARYLLFEINDEITQLLFRSSANQYLERIKSERGIMDFRVIADDTNNTPQVLDSNEFVGDLFIKPSRTINTIRLAFVAVGTGVNFEEIEG